jgi:hypothetical protein
MESRKSWFKNPLVIASLACVAAFAVACGDDDDSSNPAPSGGSKATGGTSSTAGKTNTGGTTSTAGKTATAGDGNVQTGGGGAGQAGEGSDAGAGGVPASCTDDADMGCYSCKPKTLTQFLNACPTTGCEPFDNTTLTSLPASGTLPDLP